MDGELVPTLRASPRGGPQTPPGAARAAFLGQRLVISTVLKLHTGPWRPS